MKQLTLIPALAAIFSLLPIHSLHAQGAVGRAAAFLNKMAKGADVANDAARAAPKSAPAAGFGVRSIKIPGKVFFRSFVTKDETSGCEFHKNTEGGFNVYSPSGDLVGVFQPSILGGFDVYDRNGYFVQRVD
jgi:hypothetical protein